MKSGDDHNVIQHYSHGHPLKFVDNSDSESYREACGKVCPGPAYTCKNCNFFLHESCLEIPREIQHFFHSCPLILKPKILFDCKACKKRGCSLLAYICGREYGIDCNFQMGLQFALMSRTIKAGVPQEMIQPEGRDYLEHFAHGHPFFPLELNEGDEVYCNVCKDVCSDLVHGCSRCTFIGHKSCPGLRLEIHHPFHPLHPLTMTILISFAKCSICGLSENSDFQYWCQRCWFFLDFGCARLRPSIKYDGHKHLLALFPRTIKYIVCKKCGCWGDKNILQCVACQFNIHFYCHPLLPRTIKHECLIHQLILFHSRPEEDIADASNLIWCHAREEEKDGKAPVYYCSKCGFAAHPRCVASKILPFITAKEQMPMGSALEGQSAAKEKEMYGGDSTLAKFDKHISEMRAEMDLLIAEETKLKAEIIRLGTDLKAVEEKIAMLKEKLETVERDLALHALMFRGRSKQEWKIELKRSKKGQRMLLKH